MYDERTHAASHDLAILHLSAVLQTAGSVFLTLYLVSVPLKSVPIQQSKAGCYSCPLKNVSYFHSAAPASQVFQVGRQITYIHVSLGNYKCRYQICITFKTRCKDHGYKQQIRLRHQDLLHQSPTHTHCKRLNVDYACRPE